MTTVYWQLGNLKRSRSDIQNPYIVSCGDVVYDVDKMGWDKGIRAGMPISEVKWQYSEAQIIPWHREDYQSVHQDLCRWLQNSTVNYLQEDFREGYGEWPWVDVEQWQNMVDEISSRWALRMDSGIAPNPVLAEWLAKEGRQYPDFTDHWTYHHQSAYVATSEAKDLWNALPLKYLRNVEKRMVQEWNKRGWVKVGDVPNLFSMLGGELRGNKSGKTDSLRAKRTFDEPLHQGIPALVRVLAEEVALQLKQRNQGSRHLRIIWRTVEKSEVYERTWPTPTEGTQQVITRFLTLLSALPHFPPDQVVLEAQNPEDLNMGQLTWWRSVKSHRTTPSTQWVMPVSRRNALLQYWDPWREPSAIK